MILIIAEKNSVAQDIAKALKVPVTSKSGYYSSDKYYITWASGHLFTLYDAFDYDPKYKLWKYENFPFIPSDFRYKLLEQVERNGRITDYKKQFKMIKTLAEDKKVTEIWNGCDAEREGTLIGQEIINNMKLKNKKIIKRLWIENQTEKGILKAVKSAKNMKELTSLEDASYLRQHMDWAIGINLTSVATLKFGGKRVKGVDNKIIIGRVICPTLKLIYDREMQISKFKSAELYKLKSTFKCKHGEYTGYLIDEKNENKFENKNDLNKIISLLNAGNGVVIDKTIEEEKEKAPLLFNLASLQNFIISRFDNFNAETVLNTLQSLYEKKYVSYPRTSSNYLSNDQIGEAKEVFELLKPKYKNINLTFHTDKSVFNSGKVDSHPAIIPTYVVPDLTSLTANEKIIYNAIVSRFMAQFAEVSVYEKTRILTKVNSYIFETKNRIIKKEGWLALYEKTTQPSDKVLKAIQKNDKANIQNLEIEKCITKPPKHYNDGTLIKAMETCGKNTTDIENVLKGYSIGTSATRTETIKKLLRSGYIKMEKKNILITDKGIKLVETFPVRELFDIDYTGRMEKALKDVEKGILPKEKFWKSTVRFVEKAVSLIRKGN